MKRKNENRMRENMKIISGFYHAGAHDARRINPSLDFRKHRQGTKEEMK